MKESSFHDLDELLQRLLDNQLEPEEMERLQKAICEDPRIRQHYMDSMLACAVIRRSSQVIAEDPKSDLIQSIGLGRRSGVSKRVVRYLTSVAALLIMGTLILTSVGYLRQKVKGPAIGVLTDVYEAQWQGAPLRPGESLFARSYTLQEGVAKMELDQGVRLMLEAPCRIELTRTDEMFLTSGRLGVQVAPQGIGFKVRTHAALVTDYGTEFGVVAYPDGSTETHVIKGRVSVALDPNKVDRPTSLMLDQDQAAEVDASGRTILGGLLARADHFLLQLPSRSVSHDPSDQINLADIVGGGSGLGTGVLGRGIDLGTGQLFLSPLNEILWAERNEFHLSSEIRGVDGVFVPNGSLGQVVISSTGLVFPNCPSTYGSYYCGPANSGKFFDLLSQQSYTARLHGVSYGTTRHPALSLHPNAGITFDLDEIRQNHPNINIDRFTALCGIPKNLPRPQRSAADVWVLLDGNTRLRLHFPTKQSFVEQVDVPIPAQTRFLTLATTCSGRADFSWIIFHDPYLGPAVSVLRETSP